MGKKASKKTNDDAPKEWSELTIGQKIFIVVIMLAIILMLLKSTQIPIVRDVPTGL